MRRQKERKVLLFTVKKTRSDILISEVQQTFKVNLLSNILFTYAT